MNSIFLRLFKKITCDLMNPSLYLSHRNAERFCQVNKGNKITLEDIKKMVIETKNAEKYTATARLIAGWATNDQIDPALRNSIKVMGHELYFFAMDDELKSDIREALVQFALCTEEKVRDNQEKLQEIKSLVIGG